MSSAFNTLYSNLLPAPVVEGWKSLVYALLLVAIPFLYRWINGQTGQVPLPFSAIPALNNNIPLLGNIHFFKSTTDEIVKTFCIDYMKEYGSIYRFHIGGKSFVVLSSPELVKPILESQRLIKRSIAYYALQPMLGETFFFVSDARWKSRRRTVLTVAKTKFINSVVDVFHQRSVECVEKMEQAIVAQINKSDEPQGSNEIDVVPIISQCIYDITCDTMIGKGHCKEDTTHYNNNFHSLLFNLSVYGQENNKCLKENRDFIQKVFIEKKRFLSSQTYDDEKQSYRPNRKLKEETLVDSNSNIQACDNFIDFMIQHLTTESNTMSDENVVQDTGGLMFAAQDTTSSCVTWFLYLIAKHPEHQKRVFDELKSVFGDSDRPCSTQDASKLTYLDCCIRETLRLYPSAVLIERLVTQDMEIGSYKLPAGVSVLVNIYGLHRSPLLFPEPETYNPNRFQPDNSVYRHRYAYIPFSSGARGCPGQSYALLELKVFLSVLLRNFHFSLSDPSEKLRDFTYKIVPKTIDGKMNLIVSKRLST